MIIITDKAEWLDIYGMSKLKRLFQRFCFGLGIILDLRGALSGIVVRRLRCLRSVVINQVKFSIRFVKGPFDITSSFCAFLLEGTERSLPCLP